jgi:hypothetical protein
LQPQRVAKLLDGLMARRAAKDDDHAARLAALRAKLVNAESRLGRLWLSQDALVGVK